MSTPSALTCDTSVLVAALCEWDSRNSVVRPHLADVGMLPAHTIVETYSVLTRLPHPHRIEPSEAATALAHLTRGGVLTLGEDDLRTLPRYFAERQVSGGATYDGIIALSAKRAGTTLLTLDLRAASTYVKIGAEVEYLDLQSPEPDTVT